MLFCMTLERMTKPDFNDFTLESNNGKKNAETLLKKIKI